MYHVKPAEIFPSAIKEPLVQQTHQPNHKLVVSAVERGHAKCRVGGTQLLFKCDVDDMSIYIYTK